MQKVSTEAGLVDKPKLSLWLNTAAKLSGAGFSFLLLIILARTMTPVAFADFSVILAWLAIATAAACYSMPLVLVRFVAEDLSLARFGRAKGVILFAIVMTMGASLLILLAVLLPFLLDILRLPRGLAEGVPWLAMQLPAGVVLIVFSGLLQGLKRVVAAELLINTSRPVLLILCTTVLWYMGHTPLSTVDVIKLYLMVSLLILMVSFFFAYRSLPVAVIRSSSQFNTRVWFRTASGFMAVAVAVAINEKLDILILSSLADQEEVAAYAVAARFSQTITAATIAITAVMAPYLAERIPEVKAGRLADVTPLVVQTTRTILIVTSIALVVLAVSGQLLLSLFGEYYSAAYVPLIILATGHVIAAIFGPAVSLSAFIGETRIAITALIVGIICNAALSFFLTPLYGAAGAAAAMAGCMIITASTANRLLVAKLSLNTAIIVARQPA